MVLNSTITTSSHDCIQFRNAMAENATGFERELIICVQPTMFQTAGSKILLVQVVTKEAPKGIEKGIWSKRMGNGYIENYAKSLTLRAC